MSSIIPLESLQFTSTTIQVKFTQTNGDSDNIVIDLSKMILFRMSLATAIFIEILKSYNTIEAFEQIDRIAQECLVNGLMFGNDYIKANMVALGLHRMSVKSGSFILNYEVNEHGNFLFFKEVID